MGILFSLAWAQSLSFQEALELSQQSPSVVVAQGQVELAQKQLEVAQGLISGQLSGGYTQTWGESITTVSGEEVTTSLDDGGFDAINLNATFNVVPFGPNADNIQKARWSLAEAQRNLTDAKSDAIIATIQAYLNVLRSQDTLSFQTFAVDLARQQLEAAGVRQASGAITAQQVLQTEIAFSQAQNDLSEAQRVLIQYLATLSNQLGVAVESVDTTIPESSLPEFNLEFAIEHRSDVLKAETAVLEAQLAAESTKRQYLPSGSFDVIYSSSDSDSRFSLSASYDTQSYQPSLGLSYDPSVQSQADSSSSLSLSLGAKIPIETSIMSALEVARLSIEQSQMQVERVKDLAKLEIENALRQFEAAKSTLDLSQKILEQSQQTFITANERFELGLISKLDVLESEKSLQEAELNFSKANDTLLLSLLQYAQNLALNPMEVF